MCWLESVSLKILPLTFLFWHNVHLQLKFTSTVIIAAAIVVAVAIAAEHTLYGDVTWVLQVAIILWLYKVSVSVKLIIFWGTLQMT